MISAIIYTSTSGSCEYYAREMSRKLAIPCYEAKKCGLPKGMEVSLTVKREKINVLTADGAHNILEGVQNDVTEG